MIIRTLDVIRKVRNCTKYPYSLIGDVYNHPLSGQIPGFHIMTGSHFFYVNAQQASSRHL